MKLVTYRKTIEGDARLGVIQDDLVVDVADLGDAIGEDFPGTMLDMIDAGRVGLAELGSTLEDLAGSFPINTTTA